MSFKTGLNLGALLLIGSALVGCQNTPRKEKTYAGTNSPYGSSQSVSPTPFPVTPGTQTAGRSTGASANPGNTNYITTPGNSGPTQNPGSRSFGPVPLTQTGNSSITQSGVYTPNLGSPNGQAPMPNFPPPNNVNPAPPNRPISNPPFAVDRPQPIAQPIADPNAPLPGTLPMLAPPPPQPQR